MAATVVAAASASVERATILVVDDTPDNLTLMSELLMDRYRVRVANSGERALKIAASDDAPDLILLDIMMPGMDGYEVCTRLKNGAATRDIPVIMITAHGSVDSAVEAVKLGAFDYIEKNMPGVDVYEMLIIKVDQAMDRRRQDVRTIEKWERAARAKEGRLA